MQRAGAGDGEKNGDITVTKAAATKETDFDCTRACVEEDGVCQQLTLKIEHSHRTIDVPQCSCVRVWIWPHLVCSRGFYRLHHRAFVRDTVL